MMIDGELYQIRNRDQNRLQEQINLADGGVMNPDGSYQTRDRQQLRLQDGECLNLDGEMYKNTYMHRKMFIQKNKKMMNKKMQMKKPAAKKKNVKKRVTS